MVFSGPNDLTFGQETCSGVNFNHRMSDPAAPMTSFPPDSETVPIPGSGTDWSAPERLHLAVGLAGVGLWEHDPATGITRLDPAARALFGLSEPEVENPEPILSRIHPEDRPQVTAALRAVASGRGDLEVRFRIAGETGRPLWVRGVGRRVDQGCGARILGVTQDITEERRRDAEHDLHLAEMNHRIKNLFALVGAMISSTERESGDVAGFSRNLRGRISALDRAHALMLRDDTRAPIPLRDVIERVLEPTRGEQRIRLEGREMPVPLRELTPLVLILHEWTTNSAKYGALSLPHGTLDVDWAEEAGRFRLEWRESIEAFHDQSANAANGGGFGSRLVQASILQLNAEAEREVTDRVLLHRLTMPPLVDLPTG